MFTQSSIFNYVILLRNYFGKLVKIQTVREPKRFGPPAVWIQHMVPDQWRGITASSSPAWYRCQRRPTAEPTLVQIQTWQPCWTQMWFTSGAVLPEPGRVKRGRCSLVRLSRTFLCEGDTSDQQLLGPNGSDQISDSDHWRPTCCQFK